MLGGIAAAAVFYVILQGAPPAGRYNNFLAISNTFGGAGFSLTSAFLIEVVITALFLVVIVSVTSPSAPVGFAPIAIGLALVLFHLVAIPVSNASLNPARSTATAIFGGTAALGSLWVFWVAPISAASSAASSASGCTRNSTAVSQVVQRAVVRGI